MNNFDGVLEECNSIAVDCFENESLNCNVFFLSHCHTDHMKGLKNDDFYNRLKNNCRLKLYCSQITRDLLTHIPGHERLEPYTFALSMDEPATIRVLQRNGKKTENVVVTLLPAGHCPGSVMFLFEGSFGTVLYTGDCRITVAQLREMEKLHQGNTVKKIDNLYLDTTFCIPNAMDLPSRTESRDKLFRFLDEWLARGCDYGVYLECKYQFGCEYIFVELAKRYKMKVHVQNAKLCKYQNVKEICEAVTSDCHETRLHACYYPYLKLEQCVQDGRFPCEKYRGFFPHRHKILVITLSTMWFNNYHSVAADSVYISSFNFIRILYSMHSSFREILEMVKYLNPRRVRPLVVPETTTLGQLHQQLSDCRNDNKQRQSFAESQSSVESQIVTFGPLETTLKRPENVSLDSLLVIDSVEEQYSSSSSSIKECTTIKTKSCDESKNYAELNSIKNNSDSNEITENWTFYTSPIKSEKSSQDDKQLELYSSQSQIDESSAEIESDEKCNIVLPSVTSFSAEENVTDTLESPEFVNNAFYSDCVNGSTVEKVLRKYLDPLVDGTSILAKEKVSSLKHEKPLKLRGDKCADDCANKEIVHKRCKLQL